MIEETWWAYFAGILAGEGCITVEMFPGPVARLQIKMTDKVIMQSLADVLGTTLLRKPSKNPRWRTAWTICINKEAKVRECLERSMPYLCGAKLQQAQLVIEFLDCRKRKAQASSEKASKQCYLELLRVARQIRSLSLGANKQWKEKFSREIRNLRKELAYAKMQNV